MAKVVLNPKNYLCFGLNSIGYIIEEVARDALAEQPSMLFVFSGDEDEFAMADKDFSKATGRSLYSDDNGNWKINLEVVSA